MFDGILKNEYYFHQPRILGGEFTLLPSTDGKRILFEEDELCKDTFDEILGAYIWLLLLEFIDLLFIAWLEPVLFESAVP